MLTQIRIVKRLSAPKRAGPVQRPGRSLKDRLRDRVGFALRNLVVNTTMVFGDPRKVRVGHHVSLMDALINVHSGSIDIEEFVFFGHGVTLLAGSHDFSQSGPDRMSAVPSKGYDILIQRGAWLASNVTVVGPCRIGVDAVVAAGALVRRDVAAGEIVGGVPATHLGWVAGYGSPTNGVIPAHEERTNTC